MIAMETTTGEEGAEPPLSPTFPVRCPSPATALEAERSTLASDKDEDEDGAVPGTPPQKKVWVGVALDLQGCWAGRGTNPVKVRVGEGM